MPHFPQPPKELLGAQTLTLQDQALSKRKKLLVETLTSNRTPEAKRTIIARHARVLYDLHCNRSISNEPHF